VTFDITGVPYGAPVVRAITRVVYQCFYAHVGVKVKGNSVRSQQTAMCSSDIFVRGRP